MKKIFKVQASELVQKRIIKNEKRFLIKRLIKDSLYNSTAQALVKLYNSSSRLTQLFWCICLTGACGLCAYFVIESLIDFFTYDVTMSTRTYFETTSLFPKITFCNKNAYTTKYAFDLSYSTKPPTYNDFVNFVNLKLNDTERVNLTHRIEDIIVECTYNTEVCYPSDFIREYDKYLGNCYSFNAGIDPNGTRIPLRESMRAGSSYGLRLTLYVNFYEGLLNNNYNIYMGAIIRIGNSSYSNLNYGVEIPSGFKTNIVVERYFEKTLPFPYSNCDIDNDSPHAESYSDLYDLIRLNTSFVYSQQLCYEICFNKLVVSKCNCISNDKYSLFTNQRQCASNDSCFADLSKKFLQNDFIKVNCLKSCPLQCNRTLYKTSVSSTLLMGEPFFDIVNKSSRLREDFVKRPFDIESVRSSLARVYIFYDSLAYTESVETANKISMLSLAATIGGILSLFLGVSVLSLFELIEVFIGIFFILMKKD